MSQGVELLRKVLAHRDRLSAEDLVSLNALTFRVENFARGSEIIAEHSRPDASCLIVSGLAARAVFQADGTRQLTALHIAGDFVDLHGFLLKTMDHSVMALTKSSVAFVPHEQLADLTRKSPHLTRLLWLMTVVDAAVQRRMTALIGRYTPLQRLAHLICELYVRLGVVGLVDGQSFGFPIRQAEVADLLGLSLVHTNRTIQDIRATKLVAWADGRITVADFAKLSTLCHFDPTYLSLRPEKR